MRELRGFWKWIAGLMAAAWVVIVIYTSLVGAWHPVIQGATFLSFGLALVFLTAPLSKKKLPSASPTF